MKPANAPERSRDFLLYALMAIKDEVSTATISLTKLLFSIFDEFLPVDGLGMGIVRRLKKTGTEYEIVEHRARASEN